MLSIPAAALSAVSLLALHHAAFAQAYNIDFGNPRSTPPPIYAAAGVAGVWNTLGVPASGQHALVNTQGQSAGVTLSHVGGTQLLATNDPATTGDHEALMDDMLIGFNNPVDVCIWINNLPNGEYEVLIYALTPNNSGLLSQTRVDDAVQGPTWIGGAWPGAHQLGVSYSRHTVSITRNEIGLHSGFWNAQTQSGINGIQVRRLITGDLNADGVVNVNDLLMLIGAWGPCTGCAADLNDDNVVDVNDLLMLINGWG